MSENSSQFVAFGVGMILGAFFGAVFALLYAPEAGQELRSKIQSGAQTNWEKAQIELERLKQSQSAAPPGTSDQDPSIDSATEQTQPA